MLFSIKEAVKERERKQRRSRINRKHKINPNIFMMVDNVRGITLPVKISKQILSSNQNAHTCT